MIGRILRLLIASLLYGVANSRVLGQRGPRISGMVEYHFQRADCEEGRMPSRAPAGANDSSSLEVLNAACCHFASGIGIGAGIGEGMEQEVWAKYFSNITSLSITLELLGSLGPAWPPNSTIGGTHLFAAETSSNMAATILAPSVTVELFLYSTLWSVLGGPIPESTGVEALLTLVSMGSTETISDGVEGCEWAASVQWLPSSGQFNHCHSSPLSITE